MCLYMCLYLFYPCLKESITDFCPTPFDIGCSDRVNNIVQYYRTSMIDNARGIMYCSTVMPEGQLFKWTAPGWAMSKCFMTGGPKSFTSLRPEAVFKAEDFSRMLSYLHLTQMAVELSTAPTRKQPTRLYDQK